MTIIANCHILKIWQFAQNCDIFIWQFEYDHYFENFENMTICNMTIILKFFLNFIKKKKYDNLQYDNYFKKIVIFEFQNMTKKKPMVTYGYG